MKRKSNVRRACLVLGFAMMIGTMGNMVMAEELKDTNWIMQTN